MTTASMPPDKILILAALGIGAYYMTQRRAVAGSTTPGANQLFARQNRTPSQPRQSAPAIYQANDNALWRTIGGILGKAGSGYGASPTNAPNVYQQANDANNGGPAGDSSTTGDPYSTSTGDGIAANPAPQFGAVWDYSQEYWNQGS